MAATLFLLGIVLFLLFVFFMMVRGLFKYEIAERINRVEYYIDSCYPSAINEKFVINEIESLRYKASDEELERLMRKACDKFREIDTEEV